MARLSFPMWLGQIRLWYTMITCQWPVMKLFQSLLLIYGTVCLKTSPLHLSWLSFGNSSVWHFVSHPIQGPHGDTGCCVCFYRYCDLLTCLPILLSFAERCLSVCLSVICHTPLTPSVLHGRGPRPWRLSHWAFRMCASTLPPPHLPPRADWEGWVVG